MSIECDLMYTAGWDHTEIWGLLLVVNNFSWACTGTPSNEIENDTCQDHVRSKNSESRLDAVFKLSESGRNFSGIAWVSQPEFVEGSGWVVGLSHAILRRWGSWARECSAWPTCLGPRHTWARYVSCWPFHTVASIRRCLIFFWRGKNRQLCKSWCCCRRVSSYLFLKGGVGFRRGREVHRDQMYYSANMYFFFSFFPVLLLLVCTFLVVAFRSKTVRQCWIHHTMYVTVLGTLAAHSASSSAMRAFAWGCLSCQGTGTSVALVRNGSYRNGAITKGIYSVSTDQAVWRRCHSCRSTKFQNEIIDSRETNDVLFSPFYWKENLSGSQSRGKN